eukprot:evm.model.NODE_27316_length_40306_cov_21.155485.8
MALPWLPDEAEIQPDEGGSGRGEEQHQQPFPAEALGRFDFRVKPTNFAPGFKTMRSTVLMDWDEIKLWYQGQTLLKELERREYVVKGLRWTPFEPRPPAGEPVVRHPIEPLDEEEGQSLRVLRDYGANLRPVWVDGDGSCLVHAVSTALTGSQLYYDALRWAAHKELRDHATFYQQAGFVTEQDKARFLPRLEAAAVKAAARELRDREKSMRVAATQMRDFDNSRTGRPKWTPAFLEEAVEKARPSEGEMRGPAHIINSSSSSSSSSSSKSGPAAPPIFVFLQYDHYIPLVHQDPQDFWAWANGPDSGFAGDVAALKALRLYEAERGGINHRIPEFAEEILTMCVGVAAQKMEEVLSTYEVPPADREAYRQAFGRPECMEALPLKVVFEDQISIARCDKTVKNLKTMNALFRALGMEVSGEAEATSQNNVVYLSLHVHQVDFARYHRLVWALYYLMSSGNVDQSVFKFVLNYSQNDDLNLGLARLYCEPEGWDLRPMLSPARDPKDFLTHELARLEARFRRLTGLDYRRVMDEDVAATAQAGGALGGLGGSGLVAPTDFRAKEQQQPLQQHHQSGLPSPTSSSTSAVSPRSPSPDSESVSTCFMLDDQPHHHHEEEEDEDGEDVQIQHANPDPNSLLSVSPAYKKVAWHVKRSDGTAIRTAHIREPGGSHSGGASSSSSGTAGSHAKRSPSKISPRDAGGGETSTDFVALGKRGISSPF